LLLRFRFHWSVEYFEDLRNINHCEFIILENSKETGKFELQNKLRTWSELKKERDIEEIPSTRREWGGCANGCDHVPIPPSRRKKMHAISEGTEKKPKPTRKSTSDGPLDDPVPEDHDSADDEEEVEDEDEDDPRGRVGPPEHAPQGKIPPKYDALTPPNFKDFPSNMVSFDERLRHRLGDLHTGRDGGGSHSGAGSRMGSVSSQGDGSMDDDSPPSTAEKATFTKKERSRKDDRSGMRSGVKADQLGDTAADDDMDEEGQHDLADQETRDKSLRGSVY
jgi:hypothetical protein